MTTTRLVEAYGPHPRTVGEWWLPDRHGAPVVVLVHGGFWRPQYDRTLEDPVAERLSSLGYAVWNLEYRAADAGWPTTLLDVAAGLDHVLVSAPVADGRADPRTAALVGHSAGGQLVLWAAGRRRLPAGAPGAGPRLRPTLVIAQAPVADLVVAAQRGLGSGAVETFLGGGPLAVPERYALTSPVALVPAPTRVVLIHGKDDVSVPVTQSGNYCVASVLVGGDVTLLDLPGVGHFEHLDPDSIAVRVMLEELATD